MLISFGARGPLRHYWFAVAQSTDIQDKAIAVEVLREQIVLWRGPSGKVIAAPNKCTHQAGQLHLGRVIGGRLVCPSHGWTFGDEGRCVRIPRRPEIPEDAHLVDFSCEERCGLVWVCLGTPSTGIPMEPADSDPAFRRATSSLGTWKAPAPRIIEALLKKPDGQGACSFDIPFTYRRSTHSGDGYQRVQLLTCAPVDATTSVVSLLVWSNDSTSSDEAPATEDTAGIALKEEVEAVPGMFELDETPLDDGEVTPLTAWRRALLTAASVTV